MSRTTTMCMCVCGWWPSILSLLALFWRAPLPRWGNSSAPRCHCLVVCTAFLVVPRVLRPTHCDGENKRHSTTPHIEKFERANMFRRLPCISAVLLLLCAFMCCSPQSVRADETSTPPKEINLFKGTEKISSAVWEEMADKNREEVESLHSPALVSVRGDVFVVAGARLKSDGAGSRIVVASKHLEKGGDDATEISLEAATVTYAQLVHENDKAAFRAIDTPQPAVLSVGGDIYMLLGKCSFAPSEDQRADAQHWDLVLVKGTVTEDADEKKITWVETHAVNTSSMVLPGPFTNVTVAGGSGVVMRKGVLVFPLQAVQENGVSVLLSMRLVESKGKWVFSQQATGEGCKDPSIVEWNDDRLIMLAPCAAGHYLVELSTFNGVAWFEWGEPITHVWGTSRDRQGGGGVRRGLASATVEGRKVMLLAMPVYPKEGGSGNGPLHLWLTDNLRVYDVGPVSDAEDDAAASSLLYKNDKQGGEELILLYEKKTEGSNSLAYVRLTDKLQQVSDVVRKWNALDNALGECAFTDQDELPSNAMCRGPVITDGLVGVFSGKSTDSVWMDEYLCINATVAKGQKTENVSNGLTFQGAGAGAEWPVGKAGANQPYYFLNIEFTLVATVTIHAVPKEDTPLLGLRLNDAANTVFFDLSYTSDRKWKTRACRSRPKEHHQTWKTNRTYQIVVRKAGIEWDVQVDGYEIYQRDVSRCTLLDEHKFSHLYIGGDKDKQANGTNVTVTNIFFYSRKLFYAEVDELTKTKVTIPVSGVEEPEDPMLRPGGVAAGGLGDGARGNAMNAPPPVERQNGAQVGDGAGAFQPDAAVDGDADEPPLPEGDRIQGPEERPLQEEEEGPVEEAGAEPGPEEEERLVEEAGEEVPQPNQEAGAEPGPEEEVHLVEEAGEEVPHGDSTVRESASRAWMLVFAMCGIVFLFSAG
ncbi:trans-sialidase [Trypanosoma conorhini]|uniref:Trans-sialidase n=1 Tax=Trypanosoma conorhini TaxID=83891 RepID=A0A422PBK7_9TRYP|nr:trans-sialidase [Trypanosoma conorhini]RNF15095.1 trans-sialidase [Trypanosoma conorhini]